MEIVFWVTYFSFCAVKLTTTSPVIPTNPNLPGNFKEVQVTFSVDTPDPKHVHKNETFNATFSDRQYEISKKNFIHLANVQYGNELAHEYEVLKNILLGLTQLYNSTFAEQHYKDGLTISRITRSTKNEENNEVILSIFQIFGLVLDAFRIFDPVVGNILHFLFPSNKALTDNYPNSELYLPSDDDVEYNYCKFIPMLLRAKNTNKLPSKN